jgi:hypothetical protein
MVGVIRIQGEIALPVNSLISLLALSQFKGVSIMTAPDGQYSYAVQPFLILGWVKRETIRNL